MVPFYIWIPILLASLFLLLLLHVLREKATPSWKAY